MKPSVLIAFVAGAALASGIVYMAVKPVRYAPAPVAPVAQVAAQAIQAPPPLTPVIEEKQPEKPAAFAPAVVPVPPAKPLQTVSAPRRVVAPPAPLRQKAELAEVEVAHQPASPPVLVEAKLSQPAPIPVTPPTPEPPLPVSPPDVPAAPRLDAPPAAPLAPPERVANVVTLRAGTLLNVRIGETLSTRRSRPGDNFLATLNEPLVIDNWVIAEKGSRVEGRVVDSDASGRMRGTAYLSVELVRINTADGQRVRIHTESIDRKTKSSTGEDAAKVGVGAALGAAIGAAAGGGKGAGIGAGVGAAAGAGDVLLTHSKPAEFAVETRLSFRVTDAVEITEQRRE